MQTLEDPFVLKKDAQSILATQLKPLNMEITKILISYKGGRGIHGDELEKELAKRGYRSLGEIYFGLNEMLYAGLNSQVLETVRKKPFLAKNRIYPTSRTYNVMLLLEHSDEIFKNDGVNSYLEHMQETKKN